MKNVMMHADRNFRMICLPQPKQFYQTKESFLPSSLLICSHSHLRTKGDFPCPHLVFNWHDFRSSSEEFFEPNISEVICNQSIFGHQNPGFGSVFSLKCWIRNQWIRIRNTVRAMSIYLNMYMEKMRLTRTTQVQNTWNKFLSIPSNLTMWNNNVLLTRIL
jgi:hypothetical protein